jgi:hypothetical protein
MKLVNGRNLSSDFLAYMQNYAKKRHFSDYNWENG